MPLEILSGLKRETRQALRFIANSSCDRFHHSSQRNKIVLQSSLLEQFYLGHHTTQTLLFLELLEVCNMKSYIAISVLDRSIVWDGYVNRVSGKR